LPLVLLDLADITPPPLSPADLDAINSGKQIEMIHGIVGYDAGFKYRDSFGFCIGYNRHTSSWIDCGREHAEINMQNAKPQNNK
jgi:hypothetical protein